jgi:3-oxoacyl-[acyl-carrier protein] reductase
MASPSMWWRRGRSRPTISGASSRKGSEREADLANRIPVGRLGSVDDVSNAFLFFCDPASSFVTGQTLYVCGGTSIGMINL